MKILVTGGAGYIGSNTCVELLNAGYEVVIIDNLYNAKKEVIKDIEKITNKKVFFYENDVCDKTALREIFKIHKIDAIIHFAGYKAVGESVLKPLMYYHNNIVSTLSLLEVASEFNVKKIVFSSSATVYGKPKRLPIKETDKLSTTNPYGTTKLIIEGILRDLYNSDNDWSIAILRYFNPIGAHETGLLGDDPNGIANNLMPYMINVAIGKLPYLGIFGNDYKTYDGTGVRDYIHVVDLAKGHLKAIEKVMKDKGCDAYNLGTGKGYSVLELVNTFMKVNNVKIKYEIKPRRPGDIDACYANCSYAYKKLGWKAEKTIEQMCKDSYCFAVKKYDEENK